jgi:hypothetical protein
MFSTFSSAGAEAGRRRLQRAQQQVRALRALAALPFCHRRPKPRLTAQRPKVLLHHETSLHSKKKTRREKCSHLRTSKNQTKTIIGFTLRAIRVGPFPSNPAASNPAHCRINPHHVVNISMRHHQRRCDDHAVAHGAHDQAVFEAMATADHAHRSALQETWAFPSRPLVLHQHQPGHKTAGFGHATSGWSLPVRRSALAK